MVRFVINGHVSLAKNLAAVSRALTRPKLGAVLVRAAEPMRQRMGELAPRSSSANATRLGHLAGNMLTEIVEDEADVTVAVGPAWRFWYARFDEFGTSQKSARPFMRPAFDGTQADVFDQVAAELWPLVSGAVSTPGDKAP